MVKVCIRYIFVPGYGYPKSLIVELFIEGSSLEKVLGYRKLDVGEALCNFPSLDFDLCIIRL